VDLYDCFGPVTDDVMGLICGFFTEPKPDADSDLSADMRMLLSMERRSKSADLSKLLAILLSTCVSVSALIM
jgi:hypothetical protein